MWEPKLSLPEPMVILPVTTCFVPIMGVYSNLYVCHDDVLPHCCCINTTRQAEWMVVYQA